MFSFVLVFVACLGTKCDTVNIPWDGTQITCMLFGQQLQSQWFNEHPNMTLGKFPNGRTGYRCDSGSQT